MLPSFYHSKIYKRRLRPITMHNSDIGIPRKSASAFFNSSPINVQRNHEYNNRTRSCNVRISIPDESLDSSCSIHFLVHSNASSCTEIALLGPCYGCSLLYQFRTIGLWAPVQVQSKHGRWGQLLSGFSNPNRLSMDLSVCQVDLINCPLMKPVLHFQFLQLFPSILKFCGLLGGELL